MASQDQRFRPSDQAFKSLSMRSLARTPSKLLRRRLVWLGVIDLLLGSVPVQAADARPPAFNWAGLYLGANLGAGIPLNRGERVQAGGGFGSPVFDLYPSSNTHTGVTVGAQVGYNWQHGPWVWGFETDFNLLDGRRTPNGAFVTSPAYPGQPIFSITPQTSANYFASIRGRVGIAYDRALFYLVVREKSILATGEEQSRRRPGNC
jgi:high affinity Mn2+ porin